MSRILILLGHENNEHGKLSSDALARCARATELLEEQIDLMVLPTGNFGPDFNMSNTPHGQLLAQHLELSGIDPARILPFANSADTVEDAYVARRVCKDEDAEEVIVVTSKYHLERVRHIFQRVFPDFDVTYVDAPSKGGPSDKVESRKLKRTKRTWIDVPLYRKGPDNFPTQVYEAAAGTHAHYDNISLALFSGMVAVFLFPWAADLEDRSFAFFVSIAFILIMGVLYERMALTARTAREVLRRIEVQHYSGGFSCGYSRQWWVRKPEKSQTGVPWYDRRLPEMRTLVRIAGGLLVIAQIVGWAFPQFTRRTDEVIPVAQSGTVREGNAASK